MPHGEINPRYYGYYQRAHTERALAVRHALAWLFTALWRARIARAALNAAPRLT